MISSLIVVIEMITILWCMAGLFGKKLKINFVVVVMAIINVMIYYGINQLDISPIISVFSYLFLLMHCVLEFRDSLKNTIVRYMASMIMVVVIEIISRFFVVVILCQNRVGEYCNLTCIIITLIVAALVTKTGKVKKTVDFILNNGRLLLALFSFIVFLAIKAMVDHKIDNVLGNYEAFEIVLVVLLFFVMVREWKKIKEEERKKQQQLEMNALYSDAFEELIALVRERQHDMKSHIDAILGMIYTTKSYDELVQRQKEYCTDISDYSKESKILLCVENPLIAGFLYKKVQEIYAREIEVEYDLAMSKRKLKISEYELIEIIGILTDNAIEEVEKEKSGKIKIQIRETDEEVKIIVANTSTLTDMEQISKMFGKNYSSKGVGRGIGLPKLKKMVENNKGTIEISNEEDAGDNLLQFQIVLPA